ncbi:MAG: NUDIX domain-containing protein [Syntrophobacteraceae bacterium]|jgi:colanic acid biosynthesis protein WcaH
MQIADAVATLVEQVPDASMGLPDEVFYYLSRTTPLVNVDLLVQDENGRTLLSWRDDQYAGKGWHVPGGIIRFRETLETRIRKVAETELGVDDISFEPVPVALNQIIHPTRDIRGHFISILYKCSLPAAFIPQNCGLSIGDRGYLEWHDHCPDSLLKLHEIYRKYIDRTA